MGARPFGKRPAARAADPDHPDVSALIEIIAERRGSDPLICEKIAADEIVRTTTSAMASKDPRGVHAETLIAALSALAGYACLVSARATAAMLAAAPPLAPAGNAGDRPTPLAIDLIAGTDGQAYYAGKAIAGPLFESRLSVWSIILDAVQKGGEAASPDLSELLAHVAATIGTPQFGVPRPAPGGFPPTEPPLAFVRAFWPLLLPKAKLFCPLPEQWPVLYGFAAQQAIVLCREVVPPEISVRLALECAVPMSRFDPFA